MSMPVSARLFASTCAPDKTKICSHPTCSCVTAATRSCRSADSQRYRAMNSSRDSKTPIASTPPIRAQGARDREMSGKRSKMPIHEHVIGRKPEPPRFRPKTTRINNEKAETHVGIWPACSRAVSLGKKLELHHRLIVECPALARKVARTPGGLSGQQAARARAQVDLAPGIIGGRMTRLSPHTPMARRRHVVNTPRLKKCMKPSTNSTMPTLVLGVSSACCGSAAATPNRRARETNPTLIR